MLLAGCRVKVPSPAIDTTNSLESSNRVFEKQNSVTFATKDEFLAHAKNPIAPETIKKHLNRRNPYVELRELSWLEEKERKTVRKLLGKEVRDKCRAEMDEYVDCQAGRYLNLSKCKQYANDLDRCLQKQQSPQNILRREASLIEDREQNGEGLLKRKSRAKYNRFVDDRSNTWIPVQDDEDETIQSLG